MIRRGAKERDFRASPIGLKRTIIVATLPRVQCHDCGVVRQIKVGFADVRRSYTKAWAKHARQLTRSMTITNNKIKTVQRQFYGIRDREYFELLLYSLHATKYALVG
ncbi:hypothetical protein LF1_17350 [Rubripirellula obstinata]|uniref:Transposase IS204/IS1001/IS1096/IS1165 zinc-finger domain-containing protein n=1 Tax=Rubripirellula obstinata TaxID=406547 RepID=A0A5B1CF88_9BACT|nr:hypothetical protein LF1_17350 [Rubripirellula obstinata]